MTDSQSARSLKTLSAAHDVELNTPVSPETVFDAGSISKQFTATAIMLLAEESKLGLDYSIAKYFPEAPPALKAVTIRHLLTHTSGIPDVADGTDETHGVKGVVDFHREYTEENSPARIWHSLWILSLVPSGTTATRATTCLAF